MMCIKCQQYLATIAQLETELALARASLRLLPSSQQFSETTKTTSLQQFAETTKTTSLQQFAETTKSTSLLQPQQSSYVDFDLCMKCNQATAEMTVLCGLVVAKTCWILRRYQVHHDNENKNIVGMYAGVFCKPCGKFISSIQINSICVSSPLRLNIVNK